MLSFEQLIEEHNAIGIAADAFERTLAPARPNAVTVLAARAHLCDLLRDHLAREDEHVYPRLIAASHEPTADIARRFAAQYLTLVVDWTAYLNRWTGDAMAADWRGCRAATTAIMGVLRRRIEDENAILYPTALAATALTLRKRAA